MFNESGIYHTLCGISVNSVKLITSGTLQSNVIKHKPKEVLV